MKRFRTFSSLSLSTCLALSVTVRAQNPAPVAPNALVHQVLANNPELKFYEAEIAAAKGELRSAGTLNNPELNATLGQKRVRSGGVLNDGTAWSVSVRQTFEWAGRLGLRKAIANQQVKLAELGLEQFRAALSNRAQTLTSLVYGAQEKEAAALEVAERFRGVREVLVQRDPAGLTPVLELRIIEATTLAAQRKATEARLGAQAALLELNQLLGAPWGQTVRLAPPTLTLPEAPEQAALIASAHEKNFELLVRKTELEQQGFRVALARNEQMPAVSVGPYLSRETAGDRETQFGVGVSVPLPLWNRNKGKVASEEARRLQAETVLAVAQRTLDRQIVEALLTYRTKRDEISQWKPDSVQQFKEAATLADRHYRMGAVPLSTYVELQKQYLDAVEGLLDTQREALEAGQTLQRLTGTAFMASPATATRADETAEVKP